MIRCRLLLTLLLLLVPVGAAHADTRAGGGRVAPRCKTVIACRHDLDWARRDRQHLRRLLAVKWQPTARYACALGEVAYGVPVNDCLKVIGCESGGDRFQVTPPDGASGYSQFLPSTWRGTVFGRAGFSVFDPIAPILQMDQIAAHQGFDTGYGWAASYGCHHLSGPEA